MALQMKFETWVSAGLLPLSFQVNGIMTNTGHSVIFYTGPWDEETEGESGYFQQGGNGGNSGTPNTRTLVNITGGPLSYRYQFHEIHIHYGLRDDGGSEHFVDGYAFPAEVTILRLLMLPHSLPGYNRESNNGEDNNRERKTAK
jgi:hypothetical protein